MSDGWSGSRSAAPRRRWRWHWPGPGGCWARALRHSFATNERDLMLPFEADIEFAKWLTICSSTQVNLRGVRDTHVIRFAKPLDRGPRRGRDPGRVRSRPAAVHAACVQLHGRGVGGDGRGRLALLRFRAVAADRADAAALGGDAGPARHRLHLLGRHPADELRDRAAAVLALCGTDGAVAGLHLHDLYPRQHR